MKHLSDEELIEMYYGEGSRPEGAATHLRACRECAAHYAKLEQDLGGIRRAAAPERSAEYGEQVWQALRPKLVAYEKKAAGWRGWMPWRAAGLATACALLLGLAFVGGRYWERLHAGKTGTIAGVVGPQAQKRVVLVVLTDHLDRTERLLVALEHADANDAEENAQLQSQARELLASNRLYRVSANKAGDPALAGALDRLEGVLAEVANDPNLSAADLERVRKEMNSEGILFEIRVLLAQTPDGTNRTEHGKGATI